LTFAGAISRQLAGRCVISQIAVYTGPPERQKSWMATNRQVVRLTQARLWVLIPQGLDLILRISRQHPEAKAAFSRAFTERTGRLRDARLLLKRAKIMRMQDKSAKAPQQGHDKLLALLAGQKTPSSEEFRQLILALDNEDQGNCSKPLTN